MAKKKPVYINQILKLPVTRFGKEGDIIFMHKNFIIFLKTEGKIEVRLNEFIEIRITKIMPSFALAVLVSENINITSKGCGEIVYEEGDAPINCPTVHCGDGGYLCYKCDTTSVQIANNKGDLE